MSPKNFIFDSINNKLTIVDYGMLIQIKEESKNKKLPS